MSGRGIESQGNAAQNGFVFASIPSGIFPMESRTIYKTSVNNCLIS